MASPFRQAIASGLKPDPRLTVSEWADEHRKLDSKGAAEPGPWRTERTPYLREIMDCLSVTSPVCEVTFAKGAQIGATEAGNNWMGYVIHMAPGPMLALMPTDGTAEDNVRTRIDPLIETTPEVAKRVPAKGSKEGGNTLGRKDFPGGSLYIRGANAPSKLRSLPIRYLMLDEVDAYETDLKGEGDPISLALARARTYNARRKVFAPSTPTVEGSSRVWSMFEASDQRHYFVPCPECGEFQRIEWQRIRWADETSPAWLECEHNGCVIEERHKPRMLSAGEWRATADCNDPTVRGYHLSSLYSPLGWLSWSQIRDQFLKAKREKSIAQLKTWTNTVLGMPWKEKGDAPEWSRLYARREPYERNTVPEGGLVLTAGVDVQPDRIECEVRAWGKRMESWSIDYRVFPGNTASPDGPPWRELSDMLSETWPHALGGRIRLSRLAVDSSDQTQTVYSWARRFPNSLVMAIKGSDQQSTLLGTPKRVDVREDGKRIANGVTLWIVGVSIAKSELYGWVRQAPPNPDDENDIAPTGWIHWPEYGDEYFKQLTAEQLVTRYVRGYARPQWEKTRDRNEALDCAVYNRAAAAAVGVERFKPSRWEAIRRELTYSAGDESEPATTARPRRKRKRSDYWSG